MADDLNGDAWHSKTMTRILLHVEGQTEETFVNRVLAPHLYERGFHEVSARLMGNARQRGRRGGVRKWEAIRSDILNHLRGDSGRAVGLMVDYYAMPNTWPGRVEARNATVPREMAVIVESSLAADISRELGDSFNPDRFTPYVMIHEFEAMLFSDCEAFARSIERPDLAVEFQEIRDEFNSPEDIDDSPYTAPSKRIQNLVPGYRKPTMGTLAALGIGLEKIQEECPHFKEWLEHLETLSLR